MTPLSRIIWKVGESVLFTFQRELINVEGKGEGEQSWHEPNVEETASLSFAPPTSPPIRSLVSTDRKAHHPQRLLKKADTRTRFSLQVTQACKVSQLIQHSDLHGLIRLSISYTIFSDGTRTWVFWKNFATLLSPHNC